MNPDKVREFYEQDGVVMHYASAVNRVGLWRSESLLLQRLFSRQQRLLEIGCGAGRIAFGLQQLGYAHLTAIDYASEMIQVAKAIAEERALSMDFRVGDATALTFGDGEFDGAIFGFNGLMQIPGQDRRLQALREVFRVIKPGGLFFFTTHDRSNPKYRKYWSKDREDWEKGRQRAEYREPGDRIGDTDWGEMYLHVPDEAEVEASLHQAGLLKVSCQPRSLVANEPEIVRDFSDECLIWIAKKPDPASALPL
jgi:ubiquinone/menaquinone biosynthesis C-methylase UbiE